jgi:inorganic triphosphatase YgiF
VTESNGDHLETEHKYDVDASFVLPELDSLPDGVKVAGPRRHHLSATYFDTDDLALGQNRITLRRRTGGSDEGWHLKLPVRTDTRQELHAPLGDGGTEEAPARLAARVAHITAGRPLRPIAILDTERSVVTLSGTAGGALAEIADDRVTARRLGKADTDAGSQEPLRWREIEVEAVSEDRRVYDLLDAVGKVLREAGARRSSSGSKLGRLLQS